MSRETRRRETGSRLRGSNIAHRRLLCLLGQDYGQDLAEYALLLASIALVVILGIQSLGVSIGTKYTRAAASISPAPAAAENGGAPPGAGQTDNLAPGGGTGDNSGNSDAGGGSGNGANGNGNGNNGNHGNGDNGNHGNGNNGNHGNGNNGNGNGNSGS
jgi:Flp pilus assembly pilin Flp